MRPHEFRQELDLGHGRVAEPDIGRRVLHEIRPSKRLLHLVDMPDEQGERFLVVRQRQQVVQILALMGRPGKMAGDEDRVDQIEQATHPLRDAGGRFRLALPMETPTVWTEIG